MTLTSGSHDSSSYTGQSVGLYRLLRRIVNDASAVYASLGLTMIALVSVGRSVGLPAVQLKGSLTAG